MTCKYIRDKKRRICTGDLNRKIKIQVRALETPEEDGVDFSETFIDHKTVWAMLKTTRGSQLFDGVALENPYTHEFYIRYICNVSFENWVEYCQDKYDIVDTEVLDERNEFIVLRCKKRGSKGNDANLG